MPPQIFGFANSGQVLTGTDGTWSPTGTTYARQWKRCNASGASCSNLFGQTTSIYTATDADIGSTLRLSVTATNSYGSQEATSAPTPIVIKPFDQFADEFRPALLFNTGEGWRPLSIASFFQEAVDGLRAHQTCLRGPAGGCGPINSDNGVPDQDGHVPALSIAGSGQEAYIDLAETADNGTDADSPYAECHETLSINGHETTLRDCNTGPRAVIYYDAGQDAQGYRYLDYWWFYRYNDVHGSTPSWFDDHEGDWEGLTVRIDPTVDPNHPAVVGVIYPPHGVMQWQPIGNLQFPPAANPDRNTHPAAYIAEGSHAEYPDPCTLASQGYCNNPATSYAAEEDRDGQAAWPENTSCSGCVKPLPAASNSWAMWNGRWGKDVETAGGAGWSPPSPGVQSRFLCTQSGWNCGDRPGGMPLLHAGQSSGAPNPRLCSGYQGPYTAALACDPRRLKLANLRHELTKRGRFHLHVRNRRSSDLPGMAEVMGYPLHLDEHVLLDGVASRTMTLTLHVWWRKRSWTLVIRRLDRGRHAELQLQIRSGRPTAIWTRR